MEFIIWFIVIAALTLGSVAFVRSPRFQKALLPKKPKQAKPVPLPVPQKTLREAHDELHDAWLAEYKAIIQKDCDHLYHNQSWYTCRICGQDEPWEWEAGCNCKMETFYTMGESRPQHTLQRRSPSCTVHGKDYKLMPLSDRKVGPFGGSHPRLDYNDDRPYERSRELFKDRAWRENVLPTRQRN